MSRTGVYNQPSIRGVSTVLTGVGAENPVAIYVNGFYRPFQGGLNFDFTDVSQISILKGPQGTLFGRNATGGAMLIETTKPSLTQSEADVGLSYARFNDLRMYANASTPLTDNLAIGINGYYRRSDGYLKDVAGFDAAPVRNHSITGTLVWKPTDALRLIASIEQTRISDGLGLAINSQGYSLVGALVPGTYVETRPYRTSLNHPVINPVNFVSPTLKAEYDAGPVTITSLTGWQRQTNYLSFDLDATKVPFYDQYLRERDTAFTQELDLNSKPGGRLSYVLGAYYFRSVSKTFDDYILSSPSTSFVQTNGQFMAVRSAAAFADATYEIVDHLFLTGGLRYSWEQRHMEISTPAGALAADASRSFNSVTPRAVLRYQITPQSSIYASFSKGFKSGSINIAPPYNAYKPEKLTAYEVGYKLATHGLRFDVAGYYYDYTDLQVSSLELIGGSDLQVITNAASARIYGAEAQASVQATHALSLHAAGAYTHADYRSFPNAPVTVLNPATGLNVANCTNPNPPPATVTCTQDFSGRMMPRAPKWSGNIGADYTIAAGRGSVLLSGTLSLTSGYLPNKTDFAIVGSGYRYFQPGYALLSLSATWNLPGNHLTLGLFGNNVTDTRYYIERTGNAFGDYGVLGEPATYGVRFGYKF